MTKWGHQNERSTQLYLVSIIYLHMFPPDPTKKEGFYDFEVYRECLEKYSSIANLLREKAKENGDKTWLIFEKGTRYSYKSMNDITDRMASSLLGLGVSRGDRIAIFGLNSPEWIIAYFSILKVGGIPVTVNTAFIKDSLVYNLVQPEVKYVFVDSRLLPQYVDIIDQLKLIENTIVFGDIEQKYEEKMTGKYLEFDKLIAVAKEKIPEISTGWNDSCAMILTSGTTGRSKVVVETNSEFLLTALDMIDAGGVNAESVVYVYLPLFHIMALDLATISSMLANSTMVLVEKFNPREFWNDVNNYGVTHFHAVGPILEALLKQPSSDIEKKHGQLVAIAYSSKEIWSAAADRFGIRITGGYGGTEAGIPVTSPFSSVISGRNPPGSCGKAAPPFEVTIVDKRDLPVKMGETGEILIRPRLPFATFKEYYGMKEETLEAFRDLWFHTGDLGRYDENGNIYFVDRAKDAIRRKGENISSFEVEQALLKYERIKDVAVVPLKFESGDEEVLAIVVPMDDKLSPEEIIDYCINNMPNFWIPNYVKMIPNLPKTPTGRTEKFKLKGIKESEAIKMTGYISKKMKASRNNPS